ncbi:unnamed protein product [Acanthoscelides obtectus]|uniref:Uncharacterized protein n=1 Tax=Acanthoscelides obtectus TaxID=200917 RepID=A0A9P0NYN5_ACAOB|nr:unnamed protein product [Acanthoscelides obtectus]CAK1647024.1 hypothetical protein AOBTE_LOCUS15009 [Acanthoscelides obtectus]
MGPSSIHQKSPLCFATIGTQTTLELSSSTPRKIKVQDTNTKKKYCP